MPDRLPPLNALRCFEAAARLESFSRAGDELHLTHSAISRQVRLLEEHLGTKLFDRRNRRVFLTEAGLNMFASTKEAFGRLRDTSDLVRRRSSEPLVLSCEPTLTQRWLIPRLPQLQLQFPDLVLHVRAAGGPVRFEQARIDLAIRRNDFQWPSEHFAELIIQEEVGPVCSPQLIKAGKRELLQDPLIHTATRPDAWERWLNATRRSAGANRKSFKFEHFYLSIEAAVAGLGIAIGPQPLVIDDLESGRLVAPYGFMANGFGYYLLSPKPIEQDKRSAALLAWLRTNLTKANPTILRRLRRTSC